MNRIEKQIGNHVVIHDNDQSGALLSWQYFHPGTEVPLFIKHIDDYDRWVFAIEGTKEFNKALLSYAPWSFNGWKNAFLNAPGSDFPYLNIDVFYTEGAAILRAHDQNVQSVVKGAARACAIEKYGPADDGDDYCLWRVEGLATNCPPHLTSDVGHELATQSGTFGLCWCLDKDNTCKVSLRSNRDYDVSAIAKAFGGGGHRNAAGFTTQIETLLGWLK